MKNAFLAALFGGVLVASTPSTGYAQSPPVTTAIEHASAESRISYRFMDCLAEKESGYNPSIVSRIGPWHGLYQYVLSTWYDASRQFGFGGYSVYHAWANAHVTARRIAANWGNYNWLYRQWPPAQRCVSPW